MAAPPDAARQLARSVQLNGDQIVVNLEPDSTPFESTKHALQFPPYHIGYAVTNDSKVPEEIAVFMPPLPNQDETSPHPYQSMSESNLHPLLFQLEPSPDPLRGVRKVPALVNRNTGQIEKGESGRELRYFSFLPRYISRNVSGMLLELWFRLDPRLRTNDVLDRMREDRTTKSVDHDSDEDDSARVGGPIPRHNAINMRRVRFRSEINTSSFLTGRQRPTRIEVDTLNTLTREQVLLNTCMKVDVKNGMLYQPIIKYPSRNHVSRTGTKKQNSREREIVCYVNSGLPLNYFLQPYGGDLGVVPSDRMHSAIALRHRLQSLALAQDPNKTKHDDYMTLKPIDEPDWWHDRKRGVANAGRVITELPGSESHLTWMDRFMQEQGNKEATVNHLKTPLHDATTALMPTNGASNKKRKNGAEEDETTEDNEEPNPKRPRHIRKHYRSNINMHIDSPAKRRPSPPTGQGQQLPKLSRVNTSHGGRRQSQQTVDSGYWSDFSNSTFKTPALHSSRSEISVPSSPGLKSSRRRSFLLNTPMPPILGSVNDVANILRTSSIPSWLSDDPDNIGSSLDDRMYPTTTRQSGTRQLQYMPGITAPVLVDLSNFPTTQRQPQSQYPDLPPTPYSNGFLNHDTPTYEHQGSAPMLSYPSMEETRASQLFQPSHGPQVQQRYCTAVQQTTRAPPLPVDSATSRAETYIATHLRPGTRPRNTSIHMHTRLTPLVPPSIVDPQLQHETPRLSSNFFSILNEDFDFDDPINDI